MENSTMTNIFWAILIVLPSAVLGECIYASEEGDMNKSLALKYKIAAIFSNLVAGALGVCLPMAGKKFPALSPESNFFFIMKAFAGGVILSTGFIHVLPDAFESLTSPCLPEHPWGDFPSVGLAAMLAAIGTLMVETFANSYYGRRSRAKSEGEGGADEERAVHATNGRAHGSMELDSGKTELLRYRVISKVLELGIIFHSRAIGIALGASKSSRTIKSLIVALPFLQFFEGIGLGGCITQAKFRPLTVVLMTLFFSITIPSGIVIGIGISNIYSSTNPTSLIIEGIFNSASAGILIYMALVDLLSVDFMSPKMQSNGKLQLGANASLLVGVGCISLLAKWA